MKKYKITIREHIITTNHFTVEAENIEEAELIADKIQNKIENIDNFIRRKISGRKNTEITYSEVEDIEEGEE